MELNLIPPGLAPEIQFWHVAGRQKGKESREIQSRPVKEEEGRANRSHRQVALPQCLLDTILAFKKKKRKSICCVSQQAVRYTGATESLPALSNCSLPVWHQSELLSGRYQEQTSFTSLFSLNRRKDSTRNGQLEASLCLWLLDVFYLPSLVSARWQSLEVVSAASRHVCFWFCPNFIKRWHNKHWLV